MIEALAAAASAVAFVAPALTEMAKHGAGKIGDAAAEKLLGWLRAKTTGPAREALADLERDPAAADNQADLRKRLAKLLEEEPALLDELRALLPAPAAGDTLQQHVEGAGAKGVQIKGGGNTVSIG